MLNTRVFSLVITLSIITLLIAGCGGGSGSGEPREFTVAFSGYIMGQLGPCKCPGNPLGGFARRSTALQKEIAERDGMLILDAGKWVSLDMEDGVAKSKITAALLAELGVQAVNVTMRDARLGRETLLELKEEHELPFLSANLVEAGTNKRVFPASKKISVKFKDGGELEVAVIGVCRAGPSNYMPEETNLTFIDPGPALLKAYNKVKDADCVLILCDADRSVAADWLGYLEAETGTRPDIVLSSNMHPIRSARILIGQTPMTTAGMQGKYLDLVQVIPLKETGWDIRKSGIKLDATVPDDPKILELISIMSGDTLKITH
ncbi:hypothetical protein BMS3Bbin04_01990 [bacterium BMS3Bbin04]|nr:hypothetical protein BMS3Bbin04_01990 [bacterium BMS3Bbin04]